MQKPYTINERIEFDPECDVLYQDGHYAVQLTMVVDPHIKDTVIAYGIYNRNTLVREAEVRRLALAKATISNWLTEEKAIREVQMQIDMFEKNVHTAKGGKIQ